MRVLLLTPTLGVGGSELLTVAWAAGLRDRGHVPAVAFGFSDARLPELTRQDIEALRLSDRIPGVGSLLEWRRGLRRAISSFQPDVIHAQSITCALLAAMAAPRMPLLVTVHGIEEGDERLAGMILRAAGARVTAVSEASALGIRSYRLAPHVEILRPGIDADAIVAAAAEPIGALPAGGPRFCCVARQHPAKGVDVLIRAFAQVRRSLPHATLTLVGAGVDLERNVRLAAELGLADSVHFTGLVTNSAPYVRDADVCALPSRREGLPVFALESLALGRPLVATAVGGTPTVVRDGETGWLVAPEDPDALAGAMIEAGRDLPEARARGRAGMAAVREGFSSTKTLGRIERLLEELAGYGHKRFLRGSRRRTPPVKPRPYYLAARAHERTRIARARLAKQSSEWEGVRILGYHRIAIADDMLAVTPDRFRSQMEAVLSFGAKPLTLSAALDLLDRPTTGRFFCVTFDDGFHDVLEDAVPILCELGIPATIFIPTGVISGEATYHWYREPPRALDWPEIRELVTDPLFDVEAHSRTHPRLPALPDADAWDEIAGSKEDIERLAGQKVTSFCYPAGLYGPRETRMVQEAGYRAGITTGSGVNPGGAPMESLRRTMIARHDTLDDFSAKMDGLLDRSSVVTEWLQHRRARTKIAV